MNKISLLAFIAVTILITNLSYGQESFPAERVDLLLDKTVKPKVISKSMQVYAYKNFYSKFDTLSKKLEKYKKQHRAYPNTSSTSDYNKLVGKEFNVVKIFSQKTAISLDEGRYFVLQLQNDELGTIYYDYDSKYDFNYELEVMGGLDLPEGFYCKDITIETDKFTGETKAISNYSEGISFIKVTKDEVSKIYLTINESGSTPNVGKKGLILLLENDKRIERVNAEIDVKTGSRNYVYSAFIELSEAEIDLLLKNDIIADRLYIYDGEIKNGKKLREYLKCLTK